MSRTEFLSLLAGAAVGMLGGLMVAWSRRRGSMSDTGAQLAVLALAFICFGVGEWMQASGFVAAFTGGLAFSFITSRGVDQELPTQVSDAAAQLLGLMVFAMFGAFAVIDGWRRADWRIIALRCWRCSRCGSSRCSPRCGVPVCRCLSGYSWAGSARAASAPSCWGYWWSTAATLSTPTSSEPPWWR